MKELKFSKNDPQMGDVKVIIRIIGKIIFYKFNDHQYAQQVIQQLRNKGAIINVGRHGQWVRYNMFTSQDNNLYTVGKIEIDLEKDTEEIIENKLAILCTEMYSKSGFSLE